jgi:hypothetical protein
MPRKPKSEKRFEEMLAPVPGEVLDQFVRVGPLTAAEVEAATRRFKKATWAMRPAGRNRTTRPIIATARATRRC